MVHEEAMLHIADPYEGDEIQGFSQREGKHDYPENPEQFRPHGEHLVADTDHHAQGRDACEERDSDKYDLGSDKYGLDGHPENRQKLFHVSPPLCSAHIYIRALIDVNFVLHIIFADYNKASIIEGGCGMKRKLNSEWRRLLNVLADGAWYTREVLPPPPGRMISENTVNACIDQGLVRTRRHVLKRETSASPQVYRIAIRITALGKKALKAGWYRC